MLFRFEPNFTEEEMYFVAINHDLGKIGTLEEDYYLPCEEEWMKKKGQLFVINTNIQYMKVAERSIFLLQQAGVSITENEYLAIKLHDGLYEEGNKSYLISYSEGMELKSDLPTIIHQADLMCARIEGQMDKKPKTKPKPTPANAPSVTGNKTLDKFLNE